jgi:hypothetical protein
MINLHNAGNQISDIESNKEYIVRNSMNDS